MIRGEEERLDGDPRFCQMSSRKGHIFQTGVVCKETHAGDSVRIKFLGCHSCFSKACLWLEKPSRCWNYGSLRSLRTNWGWSGLWPSFVLKHRSHLDLTASIFNAKYLSTSKIVAFSARHSCCNEWMVFFKWSFLGLWKGWKYRDCSYILLLNTDTVVIRPVSMADLRRGSWPWKGVHPHPCVYLNWPMEATSTSCVCCSASRKLLGMSVAQTLQSSFLLLTWEQAMKKTNYSGSGRSLLTDIYPMERAGCASGVL